MMRLLLLFAGLLCACTITGCLQGLEDHSRFDFKPPVLGSALNGNLEAVKKYVEAGENINIADGSGETLLMLAVVEDHVEIVKYLLDKGANPKLRNKSGETALDVSRHGKPNRSTILLENESRRVQ